MSNNDLLQLLKECRDLLKSVDEKFWSQKIAVVLESETDIFSSSQCEEISGWFGGMGSFNDLMISSVNDHNVDPADEMRLNDELERLREAIYESANQHAR